MKKLFLLLSSLLLLTLSPLFSASPTVKGATGLFEINYPFTLAPGEAGFSMGFDNTDLETGDVDVNRYVLGMGWGVFKRLEFNFSLSYHRVITVEPWALNIEFPFADGRNNGAGYASTALKYNALKSKNTGLAVNLFWDIPLSRRKQGVTTSRQAWGIDLLFAHKFTPRTIFSINVGNRFTPSPKNPTIDIGNIFRYAAGVETRLVGNLSAAVQVVGKIYHGTDNTQEDPLDLVLGLKYEFKNKYQNNTGGITLGYKRNMAFNEKTPAAAQGAVGTIWFYIGQRKNSCVLPEARITDAVVEGDENPRVGTVKSYRVVVSPTKALTREFNPVLFTWQCSANGMIHGQGGQTVAVKWLRKPPPGKSSWVKVTVSNKCTDKVACKRITLENEQ